MSALTDEFVTEIVDAINKRNFVHQRATSGIAKKIDFVFEAIIEYLEQNAHEMEWESIDLSNELLVIVAKMPSLQQDKKHRVLTVGIPIEVIKQQSKEKILEFFKQRDSSRVAREVELFERVSGLLQRYNITDIEDDDGDVDPDDDIKDNRATIKIKRTLH
jgi:proline dehydrogenase